jgi:dethiobiotin synthetase
MRGCFVTGTDTGAGKTVVAAAIAATLHAKGVRVRALKPLITGLDEDADEDWPDDHEILAAATGSCPEDVMIVGYGPAVSPHLALEMSDGQLDPNAIVAAIAACARNGEFLIVEGVGGLLVPITPQYDVARLAIDVGLPLVIAARPGLGTINHTLLTLEAARARNLEVIGVVLTPWPHAPSAVERSNRTTIAELGQVPVATLSHIDRAEPELLARAGSLLPLDEWFR